MFVIRRAQREVFEEHLRAKLVDHHVESVTLAWPEVCGELRGAAVRARVVTALAAARRHGFTESEDEARFLHLFFLWGADVEEQPWTAAILAWPAANDVKLTALEKRARIELDRRGAAASDGAPITQGV